MADSILLDPALPFALAPSAGAAWVVTGGAVTTTAPPLSDLFVDPGNEREINSGSTLNAPTLTGSPPAGDFQLSARATVAFSSTFDAGALVVWVNNQNWAKLCFEYSPSGERMVVSVVTREVSDDANAFIVQADSVWLRVSRLDNVLAFHASVDGKAWTLVRVFALAAPLSGAVVGFSVQSPTGDGCMVAFDHLSFTEGRLSELRDGS